jgi:hypothetical protein
LSRWMSRARLVSNHSTVVPGLLKLLDHLLVMPGVRTVVPGRLASTHSKPGGILRLAVRTLRKPIDESRTPF